jgi:hypothetical protein
MKQYRDINSSILLTSEESESLLEGMKSPEICARRVPSGDDAHNLAVLGPGEIDRVKDLISYRNGKSAHELSDNRKNTGR